MIFSLARPLRFDSRGMLMRNENIDAIRASVREVLTTIPGERPMRPSFGSRLRTRVFEPNDELLVRLVSDDCAEAIARHEPRVRFLSAVIVRNGRSLTARVRFEIVGTQQADGVDVEVRQ